jgi:hypothetical protein
LISDDEDNEGDMEENDEDEEDEESELYDSSRNEYDLVELEDSLVV